MFERTVYILEEYVEVDCEITKDSALVDDLGLSSLEVINIVAAFEDEFDIEIPDRIIPTLRTVGDIVKYLEENVDK
ncbi:MAG: acyl carrier protein [Bacilli bacterium]|nr:acyl carrier protein [Bacilli bacterium]